MTTGRTITILIMLILVLVSCSQGGGMTCIVYFSPNGATGEAPQQLTGESGTTVKLPDPGELRREHFLFSGWNTSMAGTGRNYEPGEDYDIAYTTTLYANWQPEKFIVSFDSAGAEGKPADMAVAYGTPVALPDSSMMRYPHKDFGGWSDGTEIYGQGVAYPVTGGVKFTAQWSDHLYTVTFDANGGKVTAPPVKAVYGDAVSLPTSLYREGFVLDGWSLELGGQKIKSPLTVQGDATLYAVWKAGPK